MLTAFYVISTQITLVVFFYGSESWFDQEKTESSDLKKRKKKQYVAQVKKLNFLMYQDRAEFLIPFPAHFLEKLRKVQE